MGGGESDVIAPLVTIFSKSTGAVLANFMASLRAEVE
jgi:hypothetical protein